MDILGLNHNRPFQPGLPDVPPSRAEPRRLSPLPTQGNQWPGHVASPPGVRVAPELMGLECCGRPQSGKKLRGSRDLLKVSVARGHVRAGRWGSGQEQTEKGP